MKVGASSPAALPVINTDIFSYSLLPTILYTFFDPLGARTEGGFGFKATPINKLEFFLFNKTIKHKNYLNNNLFL